MMQNYMDRSLFDRRVLLKTQQLMGVPAFYERKGNNTCQFVKESRPFHAILSIVRSVIPTFIFTIHHQSRVPHFSATKNASGPVISSILKSDLIKKQL